MLFDNIPINTSMIISFLFALWYYKNVENKIYNCTIYTDILTILSTIIIFSNFKNNMSPINEEEENPITPVNTRDNTPHISMLENTTENLNRISLNYPIYNEDTSPLIILQKEGFTNIVAVGHTKEAIRSLVYKRADLIEVGDTFLPFRCKQAKADYKLLEKTNVKLLEQHQYLAFSLNTPDEIVNKWQRALDKIKDNGTYERISNKEFMNALKTFNLK